MKRPMTIAALAAAAWIAAGTAQAAPLKVVASFSILGDLVRQIGGEDVTVTTLVGPDGDAHVYEPTPADARAVAEADLLVVNGLGFEGWMDRLVHAAAGKAPTVVASAGVKPLAMAEEEEEGAAEAEEPGHHHHGGTDPHAWQSVANVRLYTETIVKALAAAAPAKAPAFRERGDLYQSKLAVLEAEIRAALKPIPAKSRVIITSHDAFGYYGNAYKVSFLAPVGASTESEPSAADVAALIRQIKAEKARALFVENIADPRLLEQIARETKARIGGRVYSDALSPADGPAATYLDMMRHNTQLFAAALKPAS